MKSIFFYNQDACNFADGQSNLCYACVGNRLGRNLSNSYGKTTYAAHVLAIY